MKARPKGPAIPLPIRILGTGAHQPATIIPSSQLDELYGRAPGTTFAHSGVDSRRWAGEGETSSSMAASAVRDALDRANLDISALDALIVSAVAPEQPMPTSAVLTLAALDVPGGQCEAFDVNASCVGFLTGLQTAATGIAVGRWRYVAVVATEIASPALNHNNVESSALFGDGAAAVVLGPALETASQIHAMDAAIWPQASGACRIDAGGTRWNAFNPPPDMTAYRFRMQGVALLRHVARHLPAFLQRLESAGGIGLPEYDVVVPHQASGVGLRYLKERVGVKADAVIDILSDHGNQVSASVPTALHHAVSAGQLSRGDNVLLLGTGAGLALSAVSLRY